MKKRSGLLWLIPSLLCLVYGIFIGSIRSGTSFFLVWFVLAALFGLAAVMTYLGLWKRLPRLIRFSALGFVLVFLAVFVITEGFILSDFGRSCGEVDYLIVLGAQVRESGPSTVLQYRLDTAADYLKAHPETVCIVTGAKGSNEPVSEAEGMADYLISSGIDEQRILKEESAQNTEENIRFSRELMTDPDASCAIVTNNFHMFRALGIAKGQGMTKVLGLSASSSPDCLPNNLLREFLGVIKDSLTGHMVWNFG